MTKQEVLKYLDNVLHPLVSPDNWNVYSELHDMIEELPSAEPVRHGKWIESDEYDEFSGRLYRCSNCNTFVIGDIDNYCPFCGARMDKQETNDAAGKV